MRTITLTDAQLAMLAFCLGLAHAHALASDLHVLAPAILDLCCVVMARPAVCAHCGESLPAEGPFVHICGACGESRG